MANRFWVGGTGTWDGSNTTSWSTSTGGGGGASVPGSGDIAIFDASSGGGTVTVASSIGGTDTLQQLTAGAFTGTLDFSANNPSITFNSGGMQLSGTGARKFLLGSGTFTFTATGASTYFDIGTATNLDPTSVLTAALVFSATTTSSRSLNGGGQVLGAVTVSTNTSKGTFRIFSANTFASLSLAAGTNLMLPGAATTTISNAVTWTGTAADPINIFSNDITSNIATISFSSGSSTLTWGALRSITTTGSGTFVATNTFDFGRNTFDSGDSATAPSGGSGGGQRVFGG